MTFEEIMPWVIAPLNVFHPFRGSAQTQVSEDQCTGDLRKSFCMSGRGSGVLKSAPVALSTPCSFSEPKNSFHRFWFSVKTCESFLRFRSFHELYFKNSRNIPITQSQCRDSHGLFLTSESMRTPPLPYGWMQNPSLSKFSSC